jgi:hypothetical protein
MSSRAKPTNDAYYTKHPEVCIQRLQQLVPSIPRPIIEPSAGDGAFLRHMKFDYAYDIDPQDPTIAAVDFMTLDLPPNASFIGNPPFGYQSKTAKQFISKCISSNAALIAFILPASFKKYNMNKVFTPDYVCIDCIDYTDFYIRTESIGSIQYKLPCCFQIWLRTTFEWGCSSFVSNTIVERDVTPLCGAAQRVTTTTSKYYRYLPASCTVCDMSIRRVGSKCPEISIGKHPSSQDHFYIKLNDNINAELFVNAYNRLQFDLSNCTGPRNINKHTLNAAVNKLSLSDITRRTHS